MRLRFAFGTVALGLLLACCQSPAAAQGTTGPTIRDSNVGYIDSAIPSSLLRFQFDGAFDNTRPTRSEFFWSPGDPFGRGPDIPERSVDYQDLTVGIEEVFAEHASAFVNVPVRFLDPKLNDNTAGLMDINAGVKWAFIYQECLVASWQLRAYAPTGDASRGIGTGHTSLEPALLIYNPLGCGWVAEAELRDWIPIDGGDFAGDVIRYGAGLHYDRLCCNQFQFVPVAELVGWTALDGKVTVVDPNNSVEVEDASGDTIVNIKLGLRVRYEDVGDIYMGYGRALTGDTWYSDTFRIELRLFL